MNTKKTKGNEQTQPASKKSGKRAYSFKNKLLTSLLLALTAPLTVCLFGPLETYCGNIDEFTFALGDFFPYVILNISQIRQGAIIWQTLISPRSGA